MWPRFRTSTALISRQEAGAAAAVPKGGHHQPRRVEVSGSGAAAACEGNPPFEEGHRLADGSVVRLADLVTDALTGESPTAPTPTSVPRR
jgi:hypothetical protein